MFINRNQIGTRVIIEVRALSDYHVHVRQGDRLKTLVPMSARQCGRFLVMPNTSPPILTPYGMLKYKSEIKSYITNDSEPLMTIKLREDTNPETIVKCAENGCAAVKIYPEGVTTNSSDGISRDLIISLMNTPSSDTEKLFRKNLKTIEETEMVLCWHGEMPGEEVLSRETAILPYIEVLLENYSSLKVVFEHVTTERVVDRVGQLFFKYPGRIAATITPHHMNHTLTDLVGGLLHPHLFCKPVLKNNSDRRALVGAVISGIPCYFLGSDSAPWSRESKECSHGCAGVWNSPCLLETIADIFDQQNSLDRLEDFTSGFGDRFYGRTAVDRVLRLEKGDPWVMTEEIEGMVPYRAGDVINWKVTG